MSSGGELALQADVDTVAKQRGWRRLALPTMRRTSGASAGSQSTKGYPDRTYFRRGHVIVLEFKAEKDFKISAEQQQWLDEWHAVAAIVNAKQLVVIVAVVRPSDYDTIIRWFA